MSDFDFAMRADPAQAIRAAELVERALQRVEQRNAALAQQTTFSGVVAGLQKEAEILERIRGPMDRYKADHAALESLYRRNVITQREYNAELERMNRLMAQRPAGGAGAPAAPAATSSGGGLASAAAGYLTVGAAIGLGKEVLDLGGDYQALENRLRSVSSSQAELNALMGKTHGIADRTRSDWSTTGEAFVRLTKSTRDLGLSQDQTLRLTETLAKATKLQGASSTEASAAMLQLSQALQSGVLQGDEFRTLAETMPDLLDKIAASMGKPRSELKKLASEGQITSATIVKALQDAGPEVDAAFDRMKPTVGDAWTKFKNDATATAGELLKNSNVVELLTKALVALAQGFKDIAAVVGPVIKVVTEVAGVFSDLKDKLGFVGDALDFVTSPLKQAKAVIGVLGDAVDYFSGGPATNWLEAVQKINKEAETFRDRAEAGTQAWKGFIAIGLAVPDVLDKAGAALDRFFAPSGSGRAFFGLSEDLGNLDFSSFKKNNAAVKAAEDERKKQLDAHKKFLAETAEFRKLFDQATKPASKYERGFGGEEDLASFLHMFEMEAKLAEESAKAIADMQPNLEADLAAQEKIVAATNSWNQKVREVNQSLDVSGQALKGAQDGMNAVLASVLDLRSTIKDAITNDFQQLNETLVDAFTGGQAAWGELAHQIERDLARIALQIIEMRILMAAFGLGGGMGLASSVPGAGLFGGGHASGGSFTAPNVGGAPDSIPVMFRMSPGERADFTPKGGGRGGGGGVPVVIHNHYDERDLSSGIGRRGSTHQRAIANFVRRNPGLVRGANR